MKYISIFILLLVFNKTYSQKSGFEFLSFAKSSLESVILDYSAAIPDSSAVFKKYYLQLARAYNKAKASYSGYRGAMKDCILSYNKRKNIQVCLKSKSIDIQTDLDTLQSILNTAYIEEYSIHPIKPTNPSHTGNNTGLITGDFLQKFFDSLMNGFLKIWDQAQKNRKQYKDDYLNNIVSKEYDLADIGDLLKRRANIPPK